jgi:hypothetical protein
MSAVTFGDLVPTAETAEFVANVNEASNFNLLPELRGPKNSAVLVGWEVVSDNGARIYLTRAPQDAVKKFEAATGESLEFNEEEDSE